MSNALERSLFWMNLHIGRFVPWNVRSWVLQRLYPSGGAKPKLLVVDIVSSCNLRCPSCPVGNTGATNPTGMMEQEQFRQIIKKAYDEHHMRVVALYNWTEPFLHPQLAEFVRMSKAQGMVCAVSSNLNILRDIDNVLESGLDVLRISLSGFTQNHYGKTHSRGDIEKVKTNMLLLSEAVKRTKSTIVITVYFHKYRHNLEDLEPMHAYAQSLGFQWMESWAYYMPLEKVLQYNDGTLKPEDRKFTDEYLALPLTKALEAAKNLKGYDRCSLLEDQIVLDHRGNVNLCCTVYDFQKNGLGTFLQMSKDELKTAKSNHPTCGECVSQGLQKYFTYHDIPPLSDQYDRLAREQIALSKLGDG